MTTCSARGTGGRPRHAWSGERRRRVRLIARARRAGRPRGLVTATDLDTRWLDAARHRAQPHRRSSRPPRRRLPRGIVRRDPRARCSSTSPSARPRCNASCRGSRRVAGCTSTTACRSHRVVGLRPVPPGDARVDRGARPHRYELHVGAHLPGAARRVGPGRARLRGRHAGVAGRVTRCGVLEPHLEAPAAWHRRTRPPHRRPARRRRGRCSPTRSSGTSRPPSSVRGVDGPPSDGCVSGSR